MPKPEFEKNSKIDTRSNPFLNYRKFCQKRCILAKFWSNFSLKPVKSKTQRVLSQFSQTQRTRTRKILEFWNPKTQTRTPKRQLNSNPKKSNLDQTLMFVVSSQLISDMSQKFHVVSLCIKSSQVFHISILLKHSRISYHYSNRPTATPRRVSNFYKPYCTT